MTLEEFQARPREDWDFSVLCDELELMILSQAGWREKAERLEGEVAALYEERASYRRLSGGDQLDLNFKIHQRCEQLQRSLISAQEDVAHWEEENDGLRAALEKYGRHQGDCLPWDNPQRPFICSCGLDEALEDK